MRLHKDTEKKVKFGLQMEKAAYDKIRQHCKVNGFYLGAFLQLAAMQKIIKAGKSPAEKEQDTTA